jgi:ABC-2 type transport system permease protein
MSRSLVGNAAAIARLNVARVFRDRQGLFFLFGFPAMLTLLIGVAFGGGSAPYLGVAGGTGAGGSRPELAAALVDRLEHTEGIRVRRFETTGALTDAVQRGVVAAGVVIPDDFDRVVKGGGVGDVDYLATPGNSLAAGLQTTVSSAVAETSALVAAGRFAAAEAGASFEDGLRHAREADGPAPPVVVRATPATGNDPASGGFGLGAVGELVLFMFVNSLGAAASVVQTRRLGISRRMLSTPTRARDIVFGEGLGRFAVAMIQGAFIIVFTALLFRVHWGNVAAATALCVAYALVCTGAAMLAGATLRNENQTGALIPVGLALGALGGCMVPLEIFSPTMRRIAHVTPQAWAVEGFTTLIRTHAGLAAVAPQIGVLAAFGIALLALASWRLRKALTS